MKKVLFPLGIALLFALVVFLQSCSSYTYQIQLPKYTSIDNIYRLKLGSTLEATISVLGSKPYNVLSSNLNGYTIYEYRYKLLERKIDPKLDNQIGSETIGNPVYNDQEQILVLFFKDDKLESYITTRGLKNSSALIYINNTLYTITKDNSRYILQEADNGSVEPFKQDVPIPINFSLPNQKRH